MKNIFLCILITGMFVACQNKTDEHHHDTTMNTTEALPQKSNWRVLGTEPFWNIYIHGDTVLYTRLNEKIDSVYFTIHHYSDMDSIVEFHMTDQGKKSEGLLIIRLGSCSDGMSDKTYAYNAVFTYPEEEILKGCAEKQ